MYDGWRGGFIGYRKKYFSAAAATASLALCDDDGVPSYSGSFDYTHTSFGYNIRKALSLNHPSTLISFPRVHPLGIDHVCD